MHRSDNSLYLLYIEPKKEDKSKEPLDDMLTDAMALALTKAIYGSSSYSDLNCNGRFRHGSGYMGTHLTECGQRSSSRDHLLNCGYITNSLATYYLRWYRNSIPTTELRKLADVLFTEMNNILYPRKDVLDKINELRNV